MTFRSAWGALLVTVCSFHIYAQNYETVWSATLRVDTATGGHGELFYGCDDGKANLDNCSNPAVLSDKDFEYDGTTFTFTKFQLDTTSQGTQHRLTFNFPTTADLPDLIKSSGTLVLGSVTLPFASYDFDNNGNSDFRSSLVSNVRVVEWLNVFQLSWSDGQMLPVSILAPQRCNAVTLDAPTSIVERDNAMRRGGVFTVKAKLSPEGCATEGVTVGATIDASNARFNSIVQQPYSCREDVVFPMTESACVNQTPPGRWASQRCSCPELQVAGTQDINFPRGTNEGSVYWHVDSPNSDADTLKPRGSFRVFLSDLPAGLEPRNSPIDVQILPLNSIVTPIPTPPTDPDPQEPDSDPQDPDSEPQEPDPPSDPDPQEPDPDSEPQEPDPDPPSEPEPDDSQDPNTPVDTDPNPSDDEHARESIDDAVLYLLLDLLED